MSRYSLTTATLGCLISGAICFFSPFVADAESEPERLILPPLFVQDKQPNKFTQTLLPFYYYRREQNQRLLITPLGGFAQKYRLGQQTGIIGPYFWRSNPSLQLKGFFPLFAHWTQPQNSASTTLLFPLWLKHRSAQASADVLFPLYWRVNDSQQQTTAFVPFYWRHRDSVGANADVLFPFYWNFYGPDHRLLITPPFFHYQDASTQNTSLLPIAFYHRDNEGSSFYSLPLVYYRNDFREAKKRYLIGPFYGTSSTDSYTANLFPLFYHQRSRQNDYTYVLPVFAHYADHEAQTQTSIGGPFFYRRNKDFSAYGLFPIFMRTTTGDKSSSTTFFPLFHYQASERGKWLLTPIAGGGAGAHHGGYVGPFFYRRSPQSTTSGIFPLALRHHNYEQDATTWSISALFYSRTSPEKTFNLLFPIFWQTRQVDQSSLVVFPVWWDFNDYFLTRTTSLFPLFVRHRDTEKKAISYFFPPTFWTRDKPGGRDFVMFPLVWHFKEENTRSTVAFPLWWDFKEPQSRSTVLFPFYWRFDRPEHRTYLVLNTFYRLNKSDGTFNFHFFPILQVEKPRPDQLEVEFLFGLGGYERNGEQRKVRVFFIPFELQSTSKKTLSSFGGQRQISWTD